ncbi:hypothetical protein KSP40_PGU008447 [Platanthera guangdongensis]|uniref:Uncharacterized protein n=1 Tax=Platanthera guangdongensis TaxID=2320717 RepID=A0ABR2LT39_9ASPA
MPSKKKIRRSSEVREIPDRLPPSSRLQGCKATRRWTAGRTTKGRRFGYVKCRTMRMQDASGLSSTETEKKCWSRCRCRSRCQCRYRSSCWGKERECRPGEEREIKNLRRKRKGKQVRCFFM